MNESDYYETLQVTENADQQQIKESYRRLAFQYHPDRNQDPESSIRMKAINEAYAVLSNPAKRQDYDAMKNQYGSAAYSHFKNAYTQEDIFRGSDINHVFEEMARAFGFRSFNDIFSEAYGSGYRSFKFKRGGVSSRGYVFTSRPIGQSQGRQVKPGRFMRYVLKNMIGAELPENGADIHETIRLNPIEARDGGQHPYVSKKRSAKLLVHIPPGVHEGQSIRLAGMGEDGRGGGKTGDLYLKVKVDIALKDKLQMLFSNLKNTCMRIWADINKQV
jgi:DnaJ-class molecular chaperone